MLLWLSFEELGGTLDLGAEKGGKETKVVAHHKLVAIFVVLEEVCGMGLNIGLV